MLQLLHRRFRPKLGQRRIRDEAFMQQEITVRESFLQSLEPCVSRIAFCHCVLPKLPRKSEKLTFCQDAVFLDSASHCQVVVPPHMESPCFVSSADWRAVVVPKLVCRAKPTPSAAYLSLVWRSGFARRYSGRR